MKQPCGTTGRNPNLPLLSHNYFMLTVLSPLTILMIWVAIYRALKRNDIRISRCFYVVSALVEIVSLAVSVYITIKDITTP